MLLVSAEEASVTIRFDLTGFPTRSTNGFYGMVTRDF
jgi:hypothetical protein